VLDQDRPEGTCCSSKDLTDVSESNFRVGAAPTWKIRRLVPVAAGLR
jgi:hypothetical protein